MISDNVYGDNTFRAYGFACNDRAAIVIDAVRREKNYIEKFINKHKRILKTLDCENVDVTGKDVEIIYIMEDREMMSELASLLAEIKVIGKINIWVAYDAVLLEKHNNKLYSIR